MRGLLDLLIELPDFLRSYPMIEIGSNTGDSIQLFALFFRELYCIDAFIDDGFMRRTGDDIYTMFLEKTAGSNIKLLHCKSSDAFKPPYLNSLPLSVGLVYIDCDHSYNAVKQDIINSWPLIMEGGILAGHDYGLHGLGQDGVKPAVDEFGYPTAFIDGVENRKRGSVSGI
ncbi:hypothetical protein CCP2SC5_920005 [Azospirillaceae bacterium]